MKKKSYSKSKLKTNTAGVISPSLVKVNIRNQSDLATLTKLALNCKEYML